MWDVGEPDSGSWWWPAPEPGEHDAFDARVAAAFAERIQTVLPEAFVARAVGTAVWFGVTRPDEQSGGRRVMLCGGTECSLGAQPRTGVSLTHLGRNLLSHAQDVVSEETTVAWPPVAGDRSAMQEPHAELRDERLWLWYGDKQTTSWRCEPLALSELPEWPAA